VDGTWILLITVDGNFGNLVTGTGITVEMPGAVDGIDGAIIVVGK
jgi:hypothetical protein